MRTKSWEQLGEEIVYSTRHLLMTPSRVPSHGYYILSGKIIAYSETKGGLKQAYCIYGPGDLILVQNLLRRKESVLYYEVIEKVRVRRFHRAHLKSAIAKEPELQEDILDATLKFSDSLLENRINEQHGNAASRLSDLFLKLADSYGTKEDGKVVIQQKVSQELMGQLTGLHRITVVRELKKMQEKSLIYRESPGYVIPDLMDLKTYRNQQFG